MYKILTYYNIFCLFNLITAAYLENESNYVKPRLERNNIVNKGLWIRNNRDRNYRSGFIFSANSVDVDNVLQNNFDAVGQSNAANSAFFSGHDMDRSKRSLNDKSKPSKNEICNGDSDCLNINDRSFGEYKLIPTLKPALVFNDYPHEIAVLLNEKKDPNDISEPHKDETENVIDYKKSMNKIIKNNINKEINLTHTIFFNEMSNKSQTNRSIVTPKRSMSQPEYETLLLKKTEFDDDINNTDVNFNKIDNNIFDKEDMAWNNAPTPNINVYKNSPEKVESIKNKPVNERGLLKVLSMLTKTFKKIMKQHQDIKRIHNKLYDLNDEFTKNAELLTSKFEDFNSKYLLMLNINDELKMMEVKLKEKEDKFNNREKDLSKNLKEFERQQKKFLAQQQQFYNMQKLILAQNEKINTQQNVIVKTQSEISHRQNNFARFLKKAKQIYVDSRNLSPKLNSIVIKPKIKTSEDREHLRVHKTTTSTALPPPVLTTETVKINLFSIPALARLENQDQMIIDEKDYQPVDELIYKYYFNNTFIDDLMKNKILATFIAASEGAESNIKNKRNGKANMKSTHLIPVNKTIELNKKYRKRRWIKYTKKNNRKDIKNHSTPVPKRLPNINENIIFIDGLKKDVPKKVDPFITMALNFCKELGQDVNLQVLNWCVEKALRRLKAIDLKVSPAVPPASISTPPPEVTPKEVTVLQTSPPTSNTEKENIQNTITTEDINAVLYFPDNDELESKLKEYELKPDPEGTVYYDGSLHASDIGRIVDVDSGGFSDIMPGLNSDSRVQVDPMAFDIQAQRRADVRKINERIMKMGPD